MSDESELENLMDAAAYEEFCKEWKNEKMREWNSDMTHDNIIYDLSKKFALRVIKLYVFLSEERKEYVMSKQKYRSGTSIGQILLIA